MSISEKNKKAILEHFSINMNSPSDRKIHKKINQTPNNIANSKISNAFFENFGKANPDEFYYHREVDGSDVQAFVEYDGTIKYDPYTVMKN